MTKAQQDRAALAAQWRRDEARRVAIVAGATTIEQMAARLRDAGEMSAFTAAALGAPAP